MIIFRKVKNIWVVKTEVKIKLTVNSSEAPDKQKKHVSPKIAGASDNNFPANRTPSFRNSLPAHYVHMLPYVITCLFLERSPELSPGCRCYMSCQPTFLKVTGNVEGKMWLKRTTWASQKPGKPEKTGVGAPNSCTTRFSISICQSNFCM